MAQQGRQNARLLGCLPPPCQRIPHNAISARTSPRVTGACRLSIDSSGISGKCRRFSPLGFSPHEGIVPMGTQSRAGHRGPGPGQSAEAEKVAAAPQRSAPPRGLEKRCCIARQPQREAAPGDRWPTEARPAGVRPAVAQVRRGLIHLRHGGGQRPRRSVVRADVWQCVGGPRGTGALTASRPECRWCCCRT